MTDLAETGTVTQRILGGQQLRTAAAMLFLVAFFGTMVLSVVPLFVLDKLSGDKFDIASFFSIGSVATLIVSVIVGRFSDKLSSTKFLFFGCCVWLACGGIAISLIVDSVFKIWAVAAIFGGAYACPSILLFSAAKRFALTMSSSDGSIGNIRAGYIIGAFAGPAFGGSLLALGLEFGTIYFIQAMGYLFVAAISLRLSLFDFPNSSVANKVGSGQRNSLGDKWPVYLVAVIAWLSLSGDLFRFAALPTYLVKEFQFSSFELALMMSSVPMFEIAALFLLSRIAASYDQRFALVIGISGGIIYFAGLPFAGASMPLLLVLHAVYSFLPASILGVGLNLAQDLSKGAPGEASAIVISGQQAAILTGSALPLLLFNLLPIRFVFFAPSLLCCLALMLVVLVLPSVRHDSE